ncbi:MAG: TolC family protein [Candidatus Sericytochromatia bacterium]
MKMPKKGLALLVTALVWLGLGAAPPARAADPTLSLEQALERTYRDNPALWQLRQGQEIAKARMLQAGLGPNPEFTFVGEDLVGSSAFTADRFTQFTAGMAQTLVFGDKIGHRVRLAQLQQQLLYWDYRVRLQELGAMVYRDYARLVNLRAELVTLNELRAYAQEVHDLLSRAVAAGRLAPSVLLASEQAVRSQETEMARLKLQAQAEAQELAALWGGTADFDQLGASLELSQPDGLEKLERALAQHPRLARWQTEQQQREAALAAAQAQSAPNVQLSGGLRYHPPLDWGLVFSLGIPLPLADRNQGNIQEAELRAQMWSKERELEARTLLNQLHRAYDQAEGKARLVALLAQQVNLALAQRSAALKSFQGGKTSYLEVLNADQNLFQFRRQQVDAEGERLLAVIEVLALTRELLPEPMAQNSPVSSPEVR